MKRKRILSKYCKDSITEYDKNFTSNISSNLFVDLNNTSPLASQIYKFENAVSIPSAINMKRKLNGKYIVSIHPEIKKLGEAFGYDEVFKDYIAKNKNEAIQKDLDFCLDVEGLLFTAEKFLTQRYNLIKKADVSEFENYFEDATEELHDIMTIIPDTLSNYVYTSEDLKFDDFYNRLDYDRHSFYVKKVHNYESLRNFFKELAFSEKEYYENEYMTNQMLTKRDQIKEDLSKDKGNLKLQADLSKCERELKEIFENFDEINAIPLFTKETFAIFAVLLEEYVEKEKAVNNFIEYIKRTSWENSMFAN